MSYSTDFKKNRNIQFNKKLKNRSNYLFFYYQNFNDTEQNNL